MNNTNNNNSFRNLFIFRHHYFQQHVFMNACCSIQRNFHHFSLYVTITLISFTQYYFFFHYRINFVHYYLILFIRKHPVQARQKLIDFCTQKELHFIKQICCKCIAHSTVLGIPSSAKQVKAWKTEYDRYLKIASLLIDQLYSGINGNRKKDDDKHSLLIEYLVFLDYLCSDVTDIEKTLTAEIGDIVSTTDYAAIFSNCCNILRYLFQ